MPGMLNKKRAGQVNTWIVGGVILLGGIGAALFPIFQAAREAARLHVCQ